MSLLNRHCEERSDEARLPDGQAIYAQRLLRFARNDG